MDRQNRNREVHPKNGFIYRFIKRCFDIVASLLFLLIFGWLILLLMLIKFCEDGHNPIYTSKRVGKNGKIIKFHKIRTMKPNAEQLKAQLIAEGKNEADGPVFKMKDDPRITKVGKLLRKTSLDELPQFINVLKGDMSIIGPRPLIEGELDAHKGNHEIYESVRPGISGWCAANGRSGTSYEERLALEYYYCEHCSLWLDIKCIFKTIKVVLCRSGAK
jgi:undecaprenyl-phosphate galactose phosphotransferase